MSHKWLTNSETFAEYEFLFEFEEGEIFNHRNTIRYFEDKKLILTKKSDKKGRFAKVSLRVPDDIVTLIRGMHPLLKKRVRAALEEICSDPYCGKVLKEKLAGLRSFRIKRFRIIYKVSSKREISIVTLGPRRYIYEETFRIIRKSQKP